MSTIKIEFFSDDKNEIAQLLAALSGLNSKSVNDVKVIDAEVVTEAAAETAAETAAEAPKKTRNRAPKVDPKLEIVEDEAETEETNDDAPEDDKAGAAKYTREEVRAAVQDNKIHIEKMRVKLGELGAQSVTLLDESKFSEFMGFLKTL